MSVFEISLVSHLVSQLKQETRHHSEKISHFTLPKLLRLKYMKTLQLSRINMILTHTFDEKTNVSKVL